MCSMEKSFKGDETVIVQRKIDYMNERNLFILIYLMSVLSIIFAHIIAKPLVFVALCLFVLSILLLPNIYSYSLLFGLFPFANIFKLSPNSMSFFTVSEILLLSGIIIEHIIIKKKIKFDIFLVVALVFMMMQIVFFSKEIDLSSIIKLVVRIGLVAYYFKYIMSSKCEMSDITSVAYCFSFSMLLMMFLSLITPFRDAVLDYLRVVQYGNNIDLLRNCGLLDDPNYCSLAIMMSLTFMTVLFYYEKLKVEYWILAVPLFLIGFTTYSKSYFLMSVLFLLILFFFVLVPKYKNLAVIFFVVVTYAVLAIIDGNIEIVNNIFLRFDSNDITTGRSALNEIYINFILDDVKVLLFGEGFDVRALPRTNNVHNLFIEMLFRLGIVGSLLFFVIIISFFSKKCLKSKFINYVPVIFMFIMYMALAGLDSYGLFYYILLSGISILQIGYADESKEY